MSETITNSHLDAVFLLTWPKTVSFFNHTLWCRIKEPRFPGPISCLLPFLAVRLWAKNPFVTQLFTYKGKICTVPTPNGCCENCMIIHVKS